MNKLREKTTATLLIAIFMISTMILAVSAKPNPKHDYDTITAGEIYYSEDHYLEGEPLMIGYDPYGYNYQGHMFKGLYFNSYAGGYGYPVWDGDDTVYYELLVTEEVYYVDHDEDPETDEVLVNTDDLAEILMNQVWCWPYREVKLTMKWSDAWLSNMDRDDDGLLDRYYGYDSYIGSGAWLTNHQSGSYEIDGEVFKWNYFVKIVAVPADAYEDDGIWYTAEDVEIGEVIWGAFAIIQQVENDQGLDVHGLQYISPACAGLGSYK